MEMLPKKHFSTGLFPVICLSTFFLLRMEMSKKPQINSLYFDKESELSLLLSFLVVDKRSQINKVSPLTLRYFVPQALVFLLVKPRYFEYHRSKYSKGAVQQWDNYLRLALIVLVLPMRKLNAICAFSALLRYRAQSGAAKRGPLWPMAKASPTSIAARTCKSCRPIPLTLLQESIRMSSTNGSACRKCGTPFVTLWTMQLERRASGSSLGHRLH